MAALHYTSENIQLTNFGYVSESGKVKGDRDETWKYAFHLCKFHSKV